MKTVAAYIKELLYTHECVIVPNLGGFVTNYKPAQISDDGKFIYPPTKQLGFNSKLIINDGLLINTILNNENTTYEQAKQKVDEFVKNVFLSIDNGKKYTIKNVGQLYFDNNLNLIFAPCEKENFNIDTFGLDPINVPGNVDLAIKQKQQTKNILLSRKAKLVYLSLPLIIMLSIIGVNKINTNKNINFSSFTDVVSTTISDSVSFLERKIDSLTKKEYALYYSEKQNNKDANEKKQIIKQKLQTTTIQNKSEIPELVSELKQENEKNKQQTELKKIILELSENNAPSKIGHILRDQYGIPTTKIFGKSLKKYLEELDIKKNEDLENAIKKVDGLKEHLKNNITDRKAKHKLQHAQSRINIIKKYFGIPIRNRKKKK